MEVREYSRKDNAAAPLRRRGEAMLPRLLRFEPPVVLQIYSLPSNNFTHQILGHRK
jgi:hypothetical protein